MTKKMFGKSDKFYTSNPGGIRPAGAVVQTEIGMDQILDAFDFELKQVQTYAEIDGTMVRHEDKSSMVRVGGVDQFGAPIAPVPLSVMSNNFRVNHYRDHFAGLASQLLDEGCKLMTVGTMADGARGFAQFELPDNIGEIAFPGGDGNGGLTLNIGDSVDGSMSTCASQTLSRYVCLNVFSVKALGFGPLYNVRHTRSAGAKIAEGNEMVMKAVRNASAIKQMIERMTDTEFVESEFRALIKGIQGDCPEEDGVAKTKWANKNEALMERYHADDLNGVRNTVWGALNAVQGWSQHVRGVHGGKDNPDARTARVIHDAVFDGTDNFLAEAAGQLRQLVMA